MDWLDLDRSREGLARNWDDREHGSLKNSSEAQCSWREENEGQGAQDEIGRQEGPDREGFTNPIKERSFSSKGDEMH